MSGRKYLFSFSFTGDNASCVGYCVRGTCEMRGGKPFCRQVNGSLNTSSLLLSQVLCCDIIISQQYDSFVLIADAQTIPRARNVN